MDSSRPAKRIRDDDFRTLHVYCLASILDSGPAMLPGIETIGVDALLRPDVLETWTDSAVLSVYGALGVLQNVPVCGRRSQVVVRASVPSRVESPQVAECWSPVSRMPHWSSFRPRWWRVLRG